MSGLSIISAMARAARRNPAATRSTMGPRRRLTAAPNALYNGAATRRPAIRDAIAAHMADRKGLRKGLKAAAARQPEADHTLAVNFNSLQPSPMAAQSSAVRAAEKALAGARRSFVEAFGEEALQTAADMRTRRAQQEESRRIKRSCMRLHVDDNGSPSLVPKMAPRASSSAVPASSSTSSEPGEPGSPQSPFFCYPRRMLTYGEDDKGTGAQRALEVLRARGTWSWSAPPKTPSPRSRRSGVSGGPFFTPGTATESVDSSPTVVAAVYVGPSFEIYEDADAGEVEAGSDNDSINGNASSRASSSTSSSPTYTLAPTSGDDPLASRSPGSNPLPARDTFSPSPSPPSTSMPLETFINPLFDLIISARHKLGASVAAHLDSYRQVLKKARDAEAALRSAGIDWSVFHDEDAMADVGARFPREMHRLGYYHAHVGMARDMRERMVGLGLGLERWVVMVEEDLGWVWPPE